MDHSTRRSWILGLVLIGTLSTCATDRHYETVDAERLRREEQEARRNTAEAWLYAGEEGGYHRIVIRRGNRSARLKVATSEVRIEVPSPSFACAGPAPLTVDQIHYITP